AGIFQFFPTGNAVALCFDGAGQAASNQETVCTSTAGRDNMRKLIAAITCTAVVMMALFSSGCVLRAMTDPTYLARMDVRHRAPPAPPLKRNPNPTAYELTLTLHDPPGPFAHA